MSVRSFHEQSVLCLQCIGDNHLRLQAKQTAHEVCCDACGQLGAGVSLRELAKFIDRVLGRYFEPGETYPDYDAENDKESWEQEGESLSSTIANIAGISQEVADAIAQYLIALDSQDESERGFPAFYDESTNYIEIGTVHNHFRVWRDFSNRIKYGQRFYDDVGQKLLHDIFNDIEDFALGGKKPSRNIDALSDELVVYRARKALNRKAAEKLRLDPNSELGPPPAAISKAGRMNTAGIPVFYCALEKDTCIAEIRPNVGSYVACAAFRLCEEVKLLDLTTFESKIVFPSWFDDSGYAQRSRWEFLQSFHREIIQPIQPNDEHINYVPTQAVAEYLHAQLHFDGIKYSSAQAGQGRNNIVLFSPSIKGARAGGVEPVLEELERRKLAPRHRTVLQYVPDSVEVGMITDVKYGYKIDYSEYLE